MPYTIPEYIEIKATDGSTVAFLSPKSDNLKDCWIDDDQNGSCTLEFELPLNSPKWQYLTDQYRIHAGGKEFVILNPDAVDKQRDGQKLKGKVKAHESWVLLGKKYQTISNDPLIGTPPWGAVIIVSGGTAHGGFDAGSAGSALSYLLQGTGWTVGTVDVTGIYDLETEKESVLYNINQVQEKWGGILVWDSVNKTVSLRDEATYKPYTGYQIRYAKNLKDITRSDDYDIVTRLYVFGENDLNIEAVNGGLLYLDNHSYSDDILEGVWYNQDLADQAQLKVQGEKQLAVMCRPRHNYKTEVLDLRSLPGYGHETFKRSDMVDLFDEDFGANARVRIIRYRHNVFQPWLCDMELGDPLEKIAASVAQTVLMAKFYKNVVAPNTSFQNLLKAIINTEATEINGASGDYTLVDGVSTWFDRDDVTGELTGKLLRITPQGLIISYDGGQTWKLAISGEGFHADAGWVGKLNAGVVTVGAGTTFEEGYAPEDNRVYFQYSANGTNWHDVFNSATDLYMRQKVGDNGTWTDAARIAAVDGADGKDGINGVNGVDGQDGTPSYLHIKYSNYADGTNMNETGGLYIGTYSDSNVADSDDKAKYTWVLIKGTDGTNGSPGQDGVNAYLHIKYSNDGVNFTGNGGEDVGDWIGTYSDNTQLDSTVFGNYKWKKIRGNDGYTPVKGTDYFDGIDGQDGVNGTSSYLWVRYSQNADGSSMTTSPTNAKYIGVATTTTPSAPTSNTAYSWSLIKGSDGIPGEAGTDGQTSYLHVKYSDDGETFTPTRGWQMEIEQASRSYVQSLHKTSWAAQGFKPTENLVGATTIKASLRSNGYNGVPPDTYWHIYTDNNGVPGASISQDGFGTVLGVDWAKILSWSTAEIKLSEPLQEGQQYWLVVMSESGDSSNRVKGMYSNSDVYADGYRCSSGTSGVSWSKSTGQDLTFKIEGYNIVSYDGETPGTYIGTYVDFTQADSTTFSDYTWNKVKGEDGQDVRKFTSQPVPPYDVGDLWIGGTDGKNTLICTIARATGSFVASDWGQVTESSPSVGMGVDSDCLGLWHFDGSLNSHKGVAVDSDGAFGDGCFGQALNIATGKKLKVPTTGMDVSVGTVNFRAKNLSASANGSVLVDVLDNVGNQGMLCGIADDGNLFIEDAKLQFSETETSQADFNTGTLSDVQATSAGNLELARDGQDFTYAETSQADFQSGTLTDVTATSAGDLELANTTYTNKVIDGSIASLTNWNNTGTLITNDGAIGSTCVEYGYAWSCYQNFANRLVNGHYYFVSAYGKVVSGTGSPRISYNGMNPANIYGIGGNTSWHRFGDKVIVTDATKMEFRLLYGNAADGSSRLDGVMVVEITADEYNNLTVEQLLLKYPYTETTSTFYKHSGIREKIVDISGSNPAGGTKIEWSKTTPAGTTVKVETALSTNGGSTYGAWQEPTSGGSIPGITAGTDLSNARLKIRETLSTTDTSKTPQLHSLSIYIYAPYKSSGYRYKVYDISAVGTVGSSQISWTENKPASTTLTVKAAVSTDGGTTYGSFQNCTSGSAIPGLTQGMDISNARLKVQEDLGTSDGTVTPQLQELTIDVGSNNQTVYGPNKSTLTAWDSIALAWKSDRLSLAVNDTEACYIENPGLPAAFGSYLFIGTDRNGANAINTLVDELRIDKVYRDVAIRTGWHKTGVPFYTSEDMKQWPGYLRAETDGLKVYDSLNNLRVLVGSWLRDAVRKYGIKIVGGEIYSSLISTADEGAQNFIRLNPPHNLEVYGAFGDNPAAKQLVISAAGGGGGMWFYKDGKLVAQFGAGAGDKINLLTTENKFVVSGPGGMDVLGGLNVSGGTKNCVDPTENYGLRAMSAVESPEILFYDRGRANLVNGEATVHFDPIYLEMIEPDTDLTPWLFKTEVYGLGEDIRVTEWGDNYFKVKESNGGTSNRKFGWWHEATRNGYAGIRLMEVTN